MVKNISVNNSNKASITLQELLEQHFGKDQVKVMNNYNYANRHSLFYPRNNYWWTHGPGYPTYGIEIAGNSKDPVVLIQDFLTWDGIDVFQYQVKPQLVICNPPFNGYGQKLGSEVWLDKIIELFGKEIPLVLFCPAGFRLNLTLKSKRRSKFANEDDYLREISEENRHIKTVPYIGTRIRFNLGHNHYLFLKDDDELGTRKTVCYIKPLANGEYIHYEKKLVSAYLTQKQRQRRLKIKDQITQQTQSQFDKYYEASSIKVLITFAEYTELKKGKKLWSDFSHTLHAIQAGVSSIVEIMKLREIAENLIKDY
ncbi:4581_t:CDS:2 [Scutellospora calospora]|uniref:4581_t:CDS:1 n=1 Tax=Scutellospora calospora TaxID=85575 RepID=A0ACA9JXT2_9GLOM|nr:4581_t:CDS:2 [Scutellospora calospora]